MDPIQRRLAAILAADVVGYSRLMGKNEEGTLATLKAYREIVEALIARYAGRIFGSAGDSVIAEFASPVEAVRCATEIQLEIDKCNGELPEPERMRFRIGINLGDIIVDGANLMGDGVNVAARLEMLAPPGGICVSEAIHTHVRDRLSLDFLDLGEHRVKNIARPVHAYRVPLPSEEQVGSPFRGLDPFEFDHAGLFFGRTHAIAVCLERLEQLASSGRAFLLIYGMSGSGKSSLLRAGLLPAILKPDAVAGISLWRRCLIRPSEAPDAISSLSTGLMREGALPELGQDISSTDLAKLFASAPERGVALIRAALGKAAAAADPRPSQARLALAIDQMEELFTTDGDPLSRESFIRVLSALAASGFAWIIGTIRADFFHRCSEIKGFSGLKDGLASYELLSPTGPEIAQIIREPARAAGLRFEEDADQGSLEDVLQAAAVADPGSLPLLEFVLDALYEAGRSRRLLTFAAYRALGGLEGAIARRADEVIDGLASDIQDALPAVLRALTTVRLGDDAITARPTLRTDVATTPAKTTLVDAMIAARLLVGDEDSEGRAVLRLAHEALITRWPRARDIVNANRNFLEARARIQTDARRWLTGDRNPDLLLPHGVRLAEGEELLRSRQEEVDDQVGAYVKASSLAEEERLEGERKAERRRIEAEEGQRRERLAMEAAAAKRLARRTRYAAFVALALAIIAGGGAFFGYRGQEEARHQAALAQASADLAHTSADLAREAEDKALAARDEALKNQSLSLAFLSDQTATTGDTEAAILLALEALPRSIASPERPYLPEAEAALFKALLAHRQTLVLHHDGPVTDVDFDKTGDRIITASSDGLARIWNGRDGSEIKTLKGHQRAIYRARFSPDGARIVTGGRDGTARIWSAISGEQIRVFPQPGEVHTTLFSPDGGRVLTASDLSGLTLWDAQSGAPIVKVQSFGGSTAAVSLDGRHFAVGQGSVFRSQIRSVEDGELLTTLETPWPEVISFSPDGSRLLVTSWEHPSALFDLLGGKEIARLRGHKSDNVDGIFSHDGHLAVTASVDGAARLWNGATGELLRVFGEESSGLRVEDIASAPIDQEMNAAFSPDDRLLAVPALHGILRIWEVESGSQQAIIHQNDALIEHVAFSPDGNRVLTASHDGTARLFDVDGVMSTTLHHRKAPTFAVFSPSGNRIVTGGGDNVALIWDVGSGHKIAELKAIGGPLQYAVFSPDSRLIATAYQDGRIVVWEVQSGRERVRLTGHTATVVDVQFNPDGELLISASADGTARIWSVSTGAQIAVLSTTGLLRKALFSPDGQLALTASKDNTARLWKRDGNEFRVLEGNANRISAAAFSPDSHLVATGSLDGAARIWTIPEGKLVASLTADREALTDISFSRDSQSIITASRDGTARIWRMTDGKEMAVLREPKGIVTSAAFGPTGLYAVTTSSQMRTVRLWAVNTGRQIALLAGEENASKVEPASTRAMFNSDGTRIAIVSGTNDVKVVRAFPSPQDLIDYARKAVQRTLTPCERRHFFLPVEGDTPNCPG